MMWVLFDHMSDRPYGPYDSENAAREAWLKYCREEDPDFNESYAFDDCSVAFLESLDPAERLEREIEKKESELNELRNRRNGVNRVSVS